MSKSIFLSVLTVCLMLWPIIALARIGETVEEIQKRYGTAAVAYPSAENPGMMLGLPSTNYSFKEFVITVSFKNGKSIREVVRRKTAESLSVKECLALRDTIGAGLSWKPSETNETSIADISGYWRSIDGDIAEARGGEFVVESVAYQTHFEEYLNRKRQEEAEAAKSKAGGF